MATKTAKTTNNDATVAEVRAESEALFRSIGDGAIATDEFGHITRINPSGLSILGLTLDEAYGKWFPRVVQAVHSDGTPLALIERPIVRMFLTGKPVTEKTFYLTPSGRQVPVSLTVSPIILGGKPVGAIEVFRDITIENEIDRMKSEFISLASHQLRTPLSTVKTYAHMLDDEYMGELRPEQTRAVRTIITAADAMNEIIATLLNIARIESGSLAINAKQLDAGQLVTDAMKQLAIVAASKGVLVDFQRPQPKISLKTDNLVMKEILTNLISNAIKYTPSNGKVTIVVKTLGDNVQFEIRDNGIGIPKHSQDKIFGKFFRAPNVVREETTGTGLGLYVVKGLVSSLRGKVWFKSDEEVGTIFFVKLPKVYKEQIDHS